MLVICRFKAEVILSLLSHFSENVELKKSRAVGAILDEMVYTLSTGENSVVIRLFHSISKNVARIMLSRLLTAVFSPFTA